MNFNNATLLGLTKTSQFFGDTFRYKADKQLSIEGLILDLDNYSGVSGVLEGVNDLETGLLNNWEDIVLNGISFGSGIVNSISFSDGTDVRYKTYTVDVSIPESGDFGPASAGDYSSLDFTNFQYFESFSESSSFSRSVSSDNYAQNLTINLKTPDSLDAVAVAQTVAQNFFDNNDITDSIGAYGSYPSTKKYYNEAYDNINGEFSFSCKFDLLKGSNGLLSSSIKHSLSFDADGTIGVTEKATYDGHTETPFDTVNTQALTDIAGAYARCDTVRGVYEIGGDRTLIDKPITKSWETDPFAGTLSYSVGYTNSLNVNSIFVGSFHTYNVSVKESTAGTYTVSQQGSIVGYGELDMAHSKYTNASSFYTNAVAPSVQGDLELLVPNLNQIDNSQVHSEIEGTVNYTFNFSDNDSLLGAQQIRETVANISKEYDRNLVSTYQIVGYKEVAQVSANLQPNNYSYSISMRGKANTTVNQYLTAAKAIVSANPPSPEPVYYINSVDYDYDPFTRTFSFSLSYFSLQT